MAQAKSSLDSTFPVLLPDDEALFYDDSTFKAHVNGSVSSGSWSVTAQIMAKLQLSSETLVAEEGVEDRSIGDNKMLTENEAVAHRSSESPLLDYFTEAEKVIDGERLEALLDQSWKENPLATLKLIWNARSIHLGKSDQSVFYRSMGWLYYGHPKTLLVNLPWLYRSVIEKKVKREEDEAPILVAAEGAESEFDVLNGVSHGYWKDLLNILLLANSEQFGPRHDPLPVLYTHKQKRKSAEPAAGERSEKREKLPEAEKEAMPKEKRIFTATESDETSRLVARDAKHRQEDARHDHAVNRFKDPVYRALHLTVARLFAAQLKKDMVVLSKGSSGKHLSQLSLAAKWAPSLEGNHDKRTFIASTIAEAIYPQANSEYSNLTRGEYLKHAREDYRRTVLSPLRRALEVVERDITAERFSAIKYQKVPSLAMNRYKGLFIKKDLSHFEKYIEDVAKGQSRISGAVLMPATLVRQARTQGRRGDQKISEEMTPKQMLEIKSAQINNSVIDAQWNTLVQHIRDNGSLSSAIAVCDVSGSMSGPIFKDGTCPMDTSIGLSLLLAEIVEPPFGGRFITFSASPEIIEVGGAKDKRGLVKKIRAMESSPWGMNTNFVAVFEKLLLPMAIMHKVPPENMVKTVFVFSDMQFDASQAHSSWDSHRGKFPKLDETAHARIKKKYEAAGYELPQLVYWNLAGGRAGHTGEGDVVAPKPVTKDSIGTKMVSGYSSAQMKMFLDNGSFEESDEAEEVVEVNEETGEVKTKAVKKEMNPMDGMWKAIGHKAYSMLRVVD